MREQDGLYVFIVKGFGKLSLVTGFERLRNGRNIGVLAGSYMLSRNLGLMFYAHTGSMPAEPTSYNIALIKQLGEWQAGLWWFHPSRESNVGLPSPLGSALEASRNILQRFCRKPSLPWRTSFAERDVEWGVLPCAQSRA